MRILVLCVDRDDDFGSKTGIKGPYIGRERNIEAGLGLGLKDPEDSDVNTILAALSIYDEMVKKGVDVEVATICGDVKVGYESDMVLASQLDTVLGQIKPDRVVLVSDGAEDEFIYPMVFSRVKVDSVRRIYVKQAPTVESAYYILVKMMKDDKIRKRILTPTGLIFMVVGIFALIPKLLELSDSPDQIGIIANMTWGMLALVIGLYLLGYAFKVGERTKNEIRNLSRAVRSGSQLIPFAIVTVILFTLGIFFGLSNANTDPNADLSLRSVRFAGGVLWMWVFAVISYETGRFVNNYFSTSKIHWSYMVAVMTVFATGFIVQGTLDTLDGLLGGKNVEDSLIILEFLSGLLLAAFGGITNMALRSISQLGEGKKAECPELIEYPEA